MTSFKKVAVAGASGNIGAALVSELHAAGFTISAITRAGSASTFPPYVTVIPVDYSSIPSLVAGLYGHDAVVSCLASFALAQQPNLVEAAARVGVKRFIPAEYGADSTNALTRKFPILVQKVEVQDLVRAKQSEVGMGYTLLFTGLFLDWGLEGGMILDVKGGKGRVYDGGDRVVSMTTVKSVAKALLGCLLKPEETENRAVYVQDVAVSQNHILEVARRVDPSKEWVLEDVETAVLERQAMELFEKEGLNIRAMLGSVFRMYFGGEEYGMPFQKLDNELLGISGMSEGELEALVRQIMMRGD